LSQSDALTDSEDSEAEADREQKEEGMWAQDLYEGAAFDPVFDDDDDPEFRQFCQQFGGGMHLHFDVDDLESD
jgi:hypothetical protein